MAVTRRTLLRIQIAVLAVAAIAAVAGAIAWSRTIAGDEPDVRLDTPGEYVDPSVSNPPNDGDPLPAVALRSATGDEVMLDGDGRPMVVNLWFSTCPPCARELAYFAGVEADYGDDVRFVGVNGVDDVDTMIEFAADRGVDYELLRDPDNALVDALGVVQMPVTLFVDTDGEIVAQTGVLSEADLRVHVAELLA